MHWCLGVDYILERKVYISVIVAQTTLVNNLYIDICHWNACSHTYTMARIELKYLQY